MKQQKNPPRFLIKILSATSIFNLQEGLEGDIAEEFAEIQQSRSRRLALTWLYKQVFMSVILTYFTWCRWKLFNLKSYLVLSYRNFLKNRAYFLVNVAGLSTGMACCLILLLFINYETGFDDYHENRDNIYRLCADVKIGDTEIRNSSSNALCAAALKKDYPEVVETVRFRNRPSLRVFYKNKQFSVRRVGLTDNTVFNIFTWKLIKGDPLTALSRPYSVVLNRTTAEAVFGKTDPIGKVLVTRGMESYTVTGVFEDMPQNSTMRYNALCSMETLYTNPNQPMLTDWLSYNFRTYLLLKEGTDYRKFESKIENFLEKYAGDLLKAKKSTQKLFLQPLKDIYLRPLNSTVTPASYVNIFSVVAAFILIIACINFINLSTARASGRILEVGLRKALGAPRNQLISQFLSEAFLISFISLILASVFAVLALPAINAVTGLPLTLNITDSPWLPGISLTLGIVVGLAAGSYPAFYLSSHNPADTIRRTLKTGALNSRLRKTLVVFQFAISITLIICTSIIFTQLGFMRAKDPGFNSNNVLLIPLSRQGRLSKEVIKEKFLKIPGVINAGTASTLPGWGCPSNDKVPEGYTRASTQLMDEINVDEDYIPVMGMKLIAGRNFSSKFPADRLNSVIINETAVKQYGWKNPIGKLIYHQDPYDQTKIAKKTVIGVVRDFHQRPLNRNINPMFIGCDPQFPYSFNHLRYMVVRYSSSDTDKLVELLEQKWKELIPATPFRHYFFDEIFDQQFSSIDSSRELFSWFTSIAILIACLGLLGLSSYTAEQRTKEIGIRKVLGARVREIISLMAKEILIPVSLANIIAWPVAWYFTSDWLLRFPYRTEPDILHFISAAVTVIVISYLTVFFHTYRAATADPVKSLRYE